MKSLSQAIKLLITAICLLSFTACTTLTPVEECARLGFTLEGVNLGTGNQIVGSRSGIYSIPYRTINPKCKVPKTEEEKEQVKEIQPVAKAKFEKRNSEILIGYGALLVGTIGFTLLLLAAIEPVPRRY